MYYAAGGPNCQPICEDSTDARLLLCSGITPQTVIKAVRELIGAEYVAEERASYQVGATSKGAKAAAQMGIDQVVAVIGDLENQMKGVRCEVNLTAKAARFRRGNRRVLFCDDDGSGVWK
jgi:predicted transcriptional regulator